jgi:hypothetical protein
MDFQKIINSLLPQIGQVGVDALNDTFKDLAADQDTEWHAAALNLLADAVSVNGMAGIELARKAIDALFENEVPDINWANPRTASDFVAKIQNAEADDQSAARDFFVKVGDAFGQLFAGMVKGLIASA